MVVSSDLLLAVAVLVEVPASVPVPGVAAGGAIGAGKAGGGGTVAPGPPSWQEALIAHSFSATWTRLGSLSLVTGSSLRSSAGALASNPVVPPSEPDAPS